MSVQSELAALRASFDDAPQGDRQREPFQNNYYPFWDMKAGQRAVARFLPDKDASNKRRFLVEQVFHNLVVNGKKTKVPCLSMYGEECPICKVSQDFYKVKDEVNGKKYWRKKQYLAQALIIEDPLAPNAETGETHVGKVRTLSLGYQIYNIIKDAYSSTDDPLDAPPYDMNEGYDFIIKKTQQGEYSSYTTGTKFHSKQRALTDEELAAAEEGMIELNTLLPKNPGRDNVVAKLNADMNGEEAPEAPAPRAHKPAATRPVQHTEDDDETPAPVASKTRPAAPVAESSDEDGGSDDVDAMLATIKARRAGRSA